MTTSEKSIFLVGQEVKYLGGHFIVSGTWDDGTCDLMQDGLVVMYDVPLVDIEVPKQALDKYKGDL